MVTSEGAYFQLNLKQLQLQGFYFANVVTIAIYASKQQLIRNKSSTSASSYANSLSESHLNGRSVRLFPACLNMCQSQCLSGCPLVCPSVWLGVSVTDHKFPFTVRASYHRWYQTLRPLRPGKYFFVIWRSLCIIIMILSKITISPPLTFDICAKGNQGNHHHDLYIYIEDKLNVTQ